MCVAMCGGHSTVGRLGGLGLCVMALLVEVGASCVWGV